ncbi:uncharacterized protein LOC144293967 isoform X3 [Canis aureus]
METTAHSPGKENHYILPPSVRWLMVGLRNDLHPFHTPQMRSTGCQISSPAATIIASFPWFTLLLNANKSDCHRIHLIPGVSCSPVNHPLTHSASSFPGCSTF